MSKSTDPLKKVRWLIDTAKIDPSGAVRIIRELPETLRNQIRAELSPEALKMLDEEFGDGTTG